MQIPPSQTLIHAASAPAAPAAGQTANLRPDAQPARNQGPPAQTQTRTAIAQNSAADGAATSAARGNGRNGDSFRPNVAGTGAMAPNAPRGSYLNIVL